MQIDIPPAADHGPRAAKGSSKHESTFAAVLSRLSRCVGSFIGMKMVEEAFMTVN